MFIVGIDIAKHTHQASVMNTDGSLVGKSIKIPNTSVGFDSFISKLKEIDRDISHFEFGMEVTGHYWLNIYTHLADLGCIVHVINPVQSDALRGLYIRQTKNDIKDSAIIADVIRIGRYCETSVSDDKMLALRDLTRQRFYLVDMVSDLKRKSLTLIDRIFPEYPTLFSDTFGTTSLELLANCNTPEDILAIETDKLVEMLSTASKGRFKQDKAEKIKETARNSFGALLCTDSASFMLKQFVEQIRFLENQIDELDEMISESLAELNSPITTITGDKKLSIHQYLKIYLLKPLFSVRSVILSVLNLRTSLLHLQVLTHLSHSREIFWVQGTECQSVVPRTSDVPSGLLLPQPFFTTPLSKRFTTVRKLRANITMSALATSAVS